MLLEFRTKFNRTVIDIECIPNYVTIPDMFAICYDNKNTRAFGIWTFISNPSGLSKIRQCLTLIVSFLESKSHTIFCQLTTMVTPRRWLGPGMASQFARQPSRVTVVVWPHRAGIERRWCKPVPLCISHRRVSLSIRLTVWAENEFFKLLLLFGELIITVVFLGQIGLFTRQ